MNKLIVLAALLGFTLGNEMDFWTEGAPTGMGYTWSKTLVSSEWFTSTTFTEADFGFGTLYKNIFDDSNPTKTIKGHQYGVHLYSYARQSVTFEALKHYQYIVDVQFEPVYVAPYIQSCSWVAPRPKDTEKFSMNFAGHRYADVLNYNTYNGENMKVVEHSLYDVIADGAKLLPEHSEFGYNEEYYADWHEKKFSGNLLGKINADSYAKLQEKLLGQHQYYSKTF